MNKEKLETITNLFEGKEIRSVWNSEKGDYYYSIVDVINALTDTLDTKGIFRLIESIPSKRAELYKL